MKTALIIGISGQYGAYLSQLLLDKGYTVLGGARRSSRQPALLPRLALLGIENDIELIDFESFEYTNKYVSSNITNLTKFTTSPHKALYRPRGSNRSRPAMSMPLASFACWKPTGLSTPKAASTKLQLRKCSAQQRHAHRTRRRRFIREALMVSPRSSAIGSHEFTVSRLASRACREFYSIMNRRYGAKNS